MTNKYNLIIFIISCFATIASFTLQYLFLYSPCELCYIQRYIWISILLLSIVTLINDNIINKKILNHIITLLLFTNFIIAIYQSLIQRNIISSFFECNKTIKFSENINLNDIINNSQNVMPSCDIDAFAIFGLYIAEYNAALCFMVIIFTIIKNFKMKKSFS